MFIHVSTDFAVALQEPQDFKKFKLVIDAPGKDAARLSTALDGVATLDPEGHAWVSEDWLRRQDTAAAWQDGLTAMVGVAKKYGWVDEQKKAIRAHIEWPNRAEGVRFSKTLLITGGGRGIGAATALAAARAGWDIAINYREKSARAEAIVDEIENIGAKAIAYPADVTDERAVVALFAAIDRDFGDLHGLVNSAGIIGPHGRIDAVDAAGLERLWAINITGTLVCCREAIQRMSTKHGGKGGAIVNLSSAASRIGGAGETVPYAASKGAIDSLTFGLAQEVAAEGIRVNAVSPGVIDTEIQPEGRVARVGPNLPMKRAGKAEEVAQAILYLLSDQASYTAGTVLDVTGGR